MNCQHHINKQMRTILIDWLFAVQQRFKLKSETLFLAVNYLDRFLSINKIMKAQLQLVGVTTLFIASKYEEVKPPELCDFSYITAHSCSNSAILGMELAVLKGLDYRLTAVTPHALLIGLCQAAEVKRLAEYFLDVALLEYQMIKYTPLVQALGAVYLVHKINRWSIVITNESEAVNKCAKDMYKLHLKLKNSPFRMLNSKYGSIKLNAIQLNHLPNPY
eukprot:TRINITY_DN10183_c0_g1_i2.p1 TRINITY_DN10183_c0_g1~~TRINITY_DN10183_c0_g1_i2.p1  ORF type:complete len:219 (-),score=18.59 TRINITY_DN10183_c0_g1_i2:96-752(-)